MKINTSKHIFFLVNTLVLAMLLPGMLLAAPGTPNDTSNQSNVQSSPPNRSTSILRQLNLSNQQKHKIQEILSRRGNQIKLVLTPAQRTRLEQDLNSGTRLGIALQDVNISESQKRQAASIVQKTNQEIKAALNTQQLQQVKAYMQEQSQPEIEVPID